MYRIECIRNGKVSFSDIGLLRPHTILGAYIHCHAETGVNHMHLSPHFHHLSFMHKIMTEAHAN